MTAAKEARSAFRVARSRLRAAFMPQSWKIGEVDERRDPQGRTRRVYVCLLCRQQWMPEAWPAHVLEHFPPFTREEQSFLDAVVGRSVAMSKLAITRGLSRCPICSLWSARLGNACQGQEFIDPMAEHLRGHVAQVPPEQRAVIQALVALGSTPYQAWREATGETDWHKYWKGAKAR